MSNTRKSILSDFQTPRSRFLKRTRLRLVFATHFLVFGNQGCLPFTWKTRKFQLENQMVRIIPFGVLLKLWASGQSDAFLLLRLGFTADVHTFCMLSIFC